MHNVLKLVSETKICGRCRKAKLLAEFHKEKGKVGELASRCKPCRVLIAKQKNDNTLARIKANPEAHKNYLEDKKAYYHKIRGDKPDTRKTVKLIEGGRVCIDCGGGKAWSEFSKDKWGYNEKTATCKPCRNIKFRQVYSENPDVRRTTLAQRPDKLMRDYGLTWEQVLRAFDAQFGACANLGCGEKISLDPKVKGRNRAVIDHCHTTGDFRALLCSKCNLDLGMIETNERRFLGLLNYKNKYNNINSNQ
jgi:hypothetical protein